MKQSYPNAVPFFSNFFPPVASVFLLPSHIQVWCPQFLSSGTCHAWLIKSAIIQWSQCTYHSWSFSIKMYLYVKLLIVGFDWYRGKKLNRDQDPASTKAMLGFKTLIFRWCVGIKGHLFLFYFVRLFNSKINDYFDYS